MSNKTMFEKIWENHVIHQEEGKPSIIYIDLHLVHEVTSPQAFEGLRLSNRKVRRPELTFATMDHNVPTKDRFNIKDPISKQQIDTLSKNCADFGVRLFDLNDIDQGVVHVMGPEIGLTHPGKTIVCGDSHTSTHGAFGALAFGIGTSEVEHVMATQCLQQSKAKTMEVRFTGKRNAIVTAKDMIIGVIAKYGTDFATGYVIEYTGEAIRELSMEERMTVCNMSIEGGARAGLIAPDETTFNYLRGRQYVPQGEAYDAAVEAWKSLVSDEGAQYDTVVEFDVETLIPQVTWGTSPGMGTDINSSVPNPADFTTENERKAAEKALEYMDLTPGTPISEIPIDYVFIGSCTNGRIEDLRAAAVVAKGHKVSEKVTAIVVPGSSSVKMQAEKKDLIKSLLKLALNGVKRDAACALP